jgi:hypothetical protein
MQVDTVDMLNANSHIDAARIAAFDHDHPTTDELAHLARCPVCRAERHAMMSLQQRAAAWRMPTDAEAPRLTTWESLAGALRSEGLLSSPIESGAAAPPLTVEATSSPMRLEPVTSTTSYASDSVATPRNERVSRQTPTWLRVAAAVVLTVGGALAGRMSADPTMRTSAATATATRDVSATDSDAGNFASIPQATEILYRAQRDYERASLWLASNDTTSHGSDVYRARLAALDQMMTASRAALRDAPQDPILNHYFLSAYTAREATLKQLGVTLPVDKTLERY